MKYSYNWLKEFVPNIPEPKKLVELLTMRAFEVEGVEAIGKDTVLDIKVLFNRAFDCLSHIGMAREIAAIADTRFKIYDLRFKEQKNFRIKDFLRVEVKDKKLCPRYSARVIADVKVGESPKRMQERLVACGLRPINNVVDVANYVMLETGQPMHAFDYHKLSNNNRIKTNKARIIVRRAKKGEKTITFDSGEYELNENILVIADYEDVLAIAGIKGGKEAEIDGNTKTIVLEAASFDATSVRKSSKALNLRTDASIRFENGTDINLTVKALNRAAELIQELVDGKIASGIADVCRGRSSATCRGTTSAGSAVAHSYIERLLGIAIKSGEVLSIFKRLMLPTKMVKKSGDVFYEICVPTWRNDLNSPEDLIEEVGRLYGYESVPARMPTSVLIPAVKNEGLINEDKAKNIMVGAGYSETYNYSLISEKDKEIFGFGDLTGPRHPLSNDQKYLRPTLIAGLVKNVGGNLRYFDTIKLFEVGKVFRPEGKKIVEKRMISGVLSGKMIEDGAKLFYEAKGISDLLLNKMGVADYRYVGCPSGECHHWEDDRDQEFDFLFHPLQQARIKVGDKVICWVGRIDKKVLSSLGINEPAAAFELDFESLNELVEEEIAYRAPSRYPAIVRDLSVLVSPQTKIDEVLNIIENAGGELIVDTDLFDDVYEKGEQKGLTFRLVYQSDRKTLTDDEVNKSVEKIILAIEKEGWGVRK